MLPLCWQEMQRPTPGRSPPGLWPLHLLFGFLLSHLWPLSTGGIISPAFAPDMLRRLLLPVW